ncbi:MAG: hypothetical protein WKG07_06440 [Hymenobacter sp.]
MLLWRNEAGAHERLRRDVYRPVPRRARRARLREHVTCSSAPTTSIRARGPRRHQSQRQDRTTKPATRSPSCPKTPTTASSTRTKKSDAAVHALPPRPGERGDGRPAGFAGLAALLGPRYLLAHQLGARPAQGKAVERPT